MKKLLFILLLMVISFPMSGKDIRILAIGNSFSEDGVEQYLYELAAEGGDNLIIGNAYRGGQGLESHWNVVEKNEADFEYRKIVGGQKTNVKKTLLACVTDEKWDFITFQQVSQDSGLPATYEPWLTKLLDYVKGHATNADVKFGLHATWAYSKDSGHGGFANYGRNQDTMYKAILDAVAKSVEQHKELTFVVPSGTAIQNGRTSFIGDNFNRDGYHLSYGLGRFTAACTWLEKITGQNPVGKIYRPSSVSVVEAVVAQHAAHYANLHPTQVTPLDNVGYEGDNSISPAAVKINFGDARSLAEWNDLNPSIKSIFGLKDIKGNDTQIITLLDDEFNGTNTEGVQTTNTELNMPALVSNTCVWGFAKGQFSGSPQPTGGFLFSHLNKNLVYDFYIYGSRKNVSDNRETEYKLQGANRKRGYLNTSNNADKIALVKGIKPTDDGEIRLTVGPGKNNNNGNNFYYMNALQIIARPYADGDFDDNESMQGEIRTVDELREMEADRNYVLMNDLDLTGVSLGECILDSYSGTFDGKGHVIYGLHIDKFDSGEVGLFRHIRGGTVKNLGIANATITGNTNVGAFAGQLHGGTLENCFVINSFMSGRDHVGSLIGQLEGKDGTGGMIRNCYSTANVYSREYQGGGLVGTSTSGGGTIQNCYFAGRVEVKNPNRAAGMLALKDSDDPLRIENCVNLAAAMECGARYRIGSINGKQNATYTNNYALDNLTFTDKGSANVAMENGIDVTVARSKENDFYTTDLHWNFDAAAWKWIDGVYPVLAVQTEPVTSLVCLSQTAPVFTLKAGSMIELNKFYASGNGGTLRFTVPQDSPLTIADGTVRLADGVELTDLITVNIQASVQGFKAVEISVSLVPDVLPIATPEEFIKKVNSASNGSLKLTADLDFAGVTFGGIQNFSGKLDGNGHIIKNLNIQRDGEGCVGLFWATNNAEIKDLGIESSVIGTKSNKHIGAIIGEMTGGTISGCYVGNSRIVGQDHVGALVGQLKTGATMSNCYATSYVQTTGWQAGGLAGSIQEATITNSYFSGVVVGNWNKAGGLVGLRNGGDTSNTKIENCINLASYILGSDSPKRIMGDGGVNLLNNYSLYSTRIGGSVNDASIVPGADATSQDGANMTVEQATAASFYTETLKWDMADTWAIPVSAASYPVLKWQLDRADKIQSGVFKGTDLLSGGWNESLFLDSKGFDLGVFVSNAGLKFSYTADNANVIIAGTTLTPAVAFGASTVTVAGVTNDKFAPVSMTLTCKMVPETGILELSTPSDLLMVNDLAGREFVLANDIDMTGVVFGGLCSENTPFTGTFDGKKYVIKGLSFNDASVNSIGLFRKAKNATIKNVHLEEVNFNGNNNIGGVVGVADGGTIELCSVVNSTIEGNDRASGIAAYVSNNTKIENCYVASTLIKARAHQLGGIVAASITGGVTIRNCYFEGELSGQYGHAGSMLGLIDGDGDVTIENCLSLASRIFSGSAYRICSWGSRTQFAHFTNNYSISTTAGNLKGDADDRNGTNLPDDADAKSWNFYKNTLKWDFDKVWAIEDGNSYPVFKSMAVGIANTVINNSVTVYSSEAGVIEIIVSQPQPVNIYTVDGRLTTTVMLNEGYNRISGITSGFYIVANHKVIVK